MLFESFSLGGLQLKNRTVMAPMTRCRNSEGNVPNALMADYYKQRAGAGLIITEGASPSPNGIGYARMPGLYNAAQVKGWRLVTDAVHKAGGKIVVQLMHTGRTSSIKNMPAGARVVAPTVDVCPGQMWTDSAEMQDHTKPEAMTTADIADAVEEFAQSAKRAIDAGFDGAELHGANGYLIEQFLNGNINRRTDGYGGNAAARNRFAIEVVDAVMAAIGAARVGIRLSPYGSAGGTGAFDGVEEQYLALAEKLGSMKLMYLHLVDHSSMGAPPVPAAFKLAMRKKFGGAFIVSGGFNGDSAEQALTEKRGDLVAFGRPFLANPDLVARMKAGAVTNPPDMATFYSPGAKGYTDYPALPA